MRAARGGRGHRVSVTTARGPETKRRPRQLTRVRNGGAAAGPACVSSSIPGRVGAAPRRDFTAAASASACVAAAQLARCPVHGADPITGLSWARLLCRRARGRSESFRLQTREDCWGPRWLRWLRRHHTVPPAAAGSAPSSGTKEGSDFPGLAGIRYSPTVTATPPGVRWPRCGFGLCRPRD